MLHSSNVAFGMNQTQLGGDLREAGIIELGIRQRRNSDSAPATPPHYVASEKRARESDKRVGRGLGNRVSQIHVVVNRIPRKARTGPNAGQLLRDAVESDVDRVKAVDRGQRRRGGIVENQPLLVAGPEGIAPIDRGTGSVEDKIVDHPDRKSVV